MADAGDLPETAGYERWQVWVSAAVGLLVAIISVWWASGFAVFYETMFRVGPTVEGGGIGTDWVVGNTNPFLDFLIALTHAADVIMGLFILLMVVIHWGAFRRLAARMRQPGESGPESEPDDTVAADGGTRTHGGDPE